MFIKRKFTSLHISDSEQEEFSSVDRVKSKEIITVNGKKKIHFSVTADGEILLSSDQGHIDVYNLLG